MLRRLVPATVAAALLAAAPAAQAAQITTDRSCYAAGTTMGIQGTGFTPNAGLSLSGPGTTELNGNADASGAFSATLNTPPEGAIVPTGTTPVGLTLTATESPSGTSASTTVKVAPFRFTTSKGKTSPSAIRTWRFSGFLFKPGKPIFGHFRFGGKTLANYRFGVPTGPCGLLTKRAPLIPAASTPVGVWRVQVDYNRTFKPSETLALTSSLTVFRVFRR